MEIRFLKLREVIRGWVNYFKIANMRKISNTTEMHIALNNKTLERLGYLSLTSVYC